MKDCEMEKDDIDEVVLVGGSTRIPRVKSLLEEYFQGKTLNTSINVDEAVAVGAAIQAALLSSYSDPILRDVTLRDVTPLSLGIRIVGDIMSVIIPRNTKIPCTLSRNYTTEIDHQTSITFSVYQGERASTTDNQYLGEFILSGIRDALRTEPSIDVTFSMDADGIMQITAKDRDTGSMENLIITPDKGNRLSEDDIKRMTEEAKAFVEEDNNRRESATLMENLKTYVYGAKRAAEGRVVGVSAQKLSQLKDSCDFILVWVRQNNNRLRAKEEYETKLKDVKRICDPVLELIRRGGSN